MNRKIAISLVVVLLAVGVFALKPVIAAMRNNSQAASSQVPVIQFGSQSYAAGGPMGQNGWNPMAQMAYIQRRMNQIFDDSFARGNNFYGGRVMSFTPALDIEATPADYLVKMDLPGMEKSAIKIEQNGHKLVISGERQGENQQNNKADHFYLQERSWGSFSRMVQLPRDAQMAKIKARYKNGVLTITVPKIAGKSKTSFKQIKID